MFLLKSRRFKLIAINLFIFMSFFLSMRLVYWLAFNAGATGISSQDIGKAWWLGIKFDFRLAILLMIPIMIMAILPKVSFERKSIAVVITRCYLLLAMALLSVFYITEYYYFDYLGIKMDISILRFGTNFVISSQMVFESYPIVRITVALILFTFAFWKFTDFVLNFCFKNRHTPSRYQTIVSAVLVCCMTLALLMGKFSTMPLRWSEAFFAKNNFVNGLALNPVLFFTDTIKNRKSGYDLEKTKHYFTKTAQLLKLSNDNEALNYNKKIINTPQKIAPNVVIILMESMGSNRLGINGNALNPTPYLDKLITKSRFYSDFYVPRIGTANSVYSSIVGIPDVEEVRTASRNPLTINQHTIFNDFTDYERFYFIGGNATWANIRGVLSNNIDSLNIYEEGSYSEPLVDVWGISDRSLFKEFSEVINKRSSDKPFISFVQMAANHKPFTIPDDRGDFQVLELTTAELNRHGFVSNAQLNGVRFADYNLGKFFDSVKGNPAFDNTIFALFGDHNHITYLHEDYVSSPEILGLQGHKVPFIVYAPGIVEAKIIDKPASLVDVLPTVASLAGISYVNTTLGRDLNDDDMFPVAFIRDREPHTFGVVTKKYYLHTDVAQENVYLYDRALSKKKKVDVKDQHPQLTKELQDLAFSIYHSAKYIQYHNK